MSFSGMWIAAAQTAAFSALTKIFEHESDRWELKDVWENEAFANFTRVVLKQTAIANSTTPADASSVLSIGDGTTTTTTNASFPHLNGSAANNSTGYPPTMGTESDSSFYLGTLPCVIFVSLVTCALFYWWQVWLERMLPGRPRRVEVAYHQQQHQKHGGGSGGEKKKMVVVVEGDEDREEEVVKRWIAEGKVQRSSLSWGNTFLKWILDITVGRAALRAFWASLELVVKWKRPLSDIWGFWTWGQLLAGMLFNLVSLWPLIALVSYAVIPAGKRQPFRAAVWLLYTVFTEMLLRATIPWALNTEFVQAVLHNVTSEAEKAQMRQNLHVVDEL